MILASQALPGPAYSELEARFEVFVADPRTFSHMFPERCGQIQTIISTGGAESLSAEIIKRFPALGLICNYGVGLDHVDVGAAREAGIVICTTRGAVEQPTAELAVSLMLALARRTTEGDRQLRNGVWANRGLDQFLGMGLAGRRLGLIGFGRIGRRVARIASGLEMDCHYFRPSGPDPSSEKTYGASFSSLDEILKTCDVISLHCPANSETRNLIDERALGMMSQHALLINTARGVIVDEVALVESLQSGSIGGAGLDVFVNEPNVPSELVLLENVVLTPHLGSSTEAARNMMTDIVASQIASWDEGRAPSSRIL